MTKLYHIEITPIEQAPPHRRREWEYNLSFEELDHRFLAPYRKGDSIVTRGRTIAMDNLHRIRVYETQQKVGNLANIPTGTLKDITKELIAGPAGWESAESSRHGDENRPHIDTKEVFVVHGRNELARKAMFDFLRAIGLHPLEWSELVQAAGSTSPYIGQILDAAFRKAHAVVVLLTPDDEARLRESLRAEGDPSHETEPTGQARANVLFESGMAMGRNQYRTVLVELGNLRPFTDIAGLHVIRMDNSSQRRQELAQRLEIAGCPVNLSGTDWHTVGDFEASIAAIVKETSSPEAVDQVTDPSSNIGVSDDAQDLLIETTKDANGEILKLIAMGVRSLRTNGKHFGEFGNSRSQARWEGALNDLLSLGLLVEDTANPDRLFKVTREGFAFADAIAS